jgi:mannosyl-glycoprotein endo-beta-N-acetylglucosaminidase
VKKNISALLKTVCISAMFIGLFPKGYQAYTDLSTFNIQTGNFAGEQSAITALRQLENDTNWTGRYEQIGQSEDYYQIISGGFSGQARAKEILNQFVTTTKIPATYVGLGTPQYYYQLITGGFSGEDKVQHVLQQLKEKTQINGTYFGLGERQNYYQLISGGFSGEATANRVMQQFESSTGINANLMGLGEQLPYYQIISGGFSGEARAKEILDQFQSNTGIVADMVGIGDPQTYYQIISGGFSGEANVQQVLQQFIQSTGIPATYIHIGDNRYQIISEPVLGLTLVNKGREFFKSNNWSVTYQSTGQTGYERYQIISKPVLGLALVNKGREFFKSNNWSVTYKSTGQTGYERYQMISDPVLGIDLVNEGREFFKSNNWSITYRATGQTGYERYQIKSELLLGMDLVNQGREFFKSNNWSVTYQSAGIVGYDRYQIKSAPVLGMDVVNKGREFFKSNNWSVTYVKTGDVEDYYQIVIDDIVGSDNANAAIQRIDQLYGWTATAVKTKNGPQLMYTDYGMSLNAMLDIQMTRYPQTDLYRNYPRYIHKDFVDINTGVITGDNVNLRTEPSTSGSIVGQLNNGNEVIVIGVTGDWVEVRITWQNAMASDVSYYLSPNNFTLDSKGYFQFLKLSQPANLDVNEVNNKILAGKGILSGRGQAFIDAAKLYQVNDVYLISHSLLETGHGTSPLATGIEYNGKIVYNMYGVGAFDSCPLSCGAKTAYDNGWFTPEAAIIGGAQFISRDYIYNPTFPQDTLYKMRWNPAQPWHQYATDIGWAYKQVDSIYNIYQLIDNYTLYFDVASYR